MSYYDTLSPNIAIHSPAAENVVHQQQTRFVIGEFPKIITARALDDTLIHFWSAAQKGDPARRFLYNYQILEYASFYFIEDDIKKRVQRLLAAPHALGNLPRTTEDIIDVVGQSKVYEGAMMDQAVRAIVDHRLIWREVETNKKVFCEKLTFAGGFELEPFARASMTEKDFKGNGVSAFVSCLRQIRNALSHGKERRMATVIAPTRANLEKLQLWLPLVTVTTNKVMAYRGAS